jgi:hypothetical protein
LISNLKYHGSPVKLDLVSMKPKDTKYNLVVGFSYKEGPLFCFTFSNFDRELGGCLNSLGDLSRIASDFEGFDVRLKDSYMYL